MMPDILGYKSTTVTIGLVVLILIASFIIFGINTEIFSLSHQTASSFEGPGIENPVTTTKETGTPESSSDSLFWLNSGGLVFNKSGLSHTILGDLPSSSNWRKKYAATNPLDTDSGYHPQNIFRLITKSAYEDSIGRMYVLVVNDNISQSPNRNYSNGIFLISRYQDSNNLYCAGVRVDGTAVIKKKINGVYHTLNQALLFEGDVYDRNSHPSLLPKNQWIGLEVSVKTISLDQVRIDLSVDRNNNGKWTKILSALDAPYGDTPPIVASGHGGIRSDFMDIEFRDFSFSPLASTPFTSP